MTSCLVRVYYKNEIIDFDSREESKQWLEEKTSAEESA